MLTMRKMFLLACVVMSSGFSLFAADEVREIPFLAHVPKIDGELGLAEWQGALRFADFTETSEKSQTKVIPPGLRTEAWLAQTISGLCVAFRCWHDQMGQMWTAATEHDGPVWNDDSVEIFLDAHGTRYSYYHLIVNAAGICYDAFNKEPHRGDITWDSGALAAGSILADGYYVEMLIPWTSLNLGLNRCGRIGLNLCRNVRYTVGRQSLFGEYHRPATWQEFRLERTGPKWFPVVAEQFMWSDLSGANELIARFRNLTQAPLRLVGEFVVVQDMHRNEQRFGLVCEAEQNAEAHLPYTVSDKSWADFSLTLRNGKGEVLLTAHRRLQPRLIARVSVDTDVLLRGETPLVTVSLAVAGSTAQEYAVQFDVRSTDGHQVLNRAVRPVHRTSFVEALDLSAAPAKIQRLYIATTVTHAPSGRVVFQGKTPLYIIGSPWSEPQGSR